MITTTRSQNHRNAKPRSARGFTLVEVMVAASLSTIILAGTITVFLFLGRSGANLRNYSDMESQARKSLEIFAQDTRQASSVQWSSADSVKLNVKGVEIYYTYASGVFTRKAGTGTMQQLLTGITNFSFSAYDINGGGITDFSTTTARTSAGNSTKQIQISLSAARSTKTVTTASNLVLSARYVLRNKRVTA
jgi:prepilin-type N-terminal cleavage/methylation domain-containing protein